MYAEFDFQNVHNAIADFLESSGDSEVSKSMTLSLLYGVMPDNLLRAAKQIKGNYGGIVDQTSELIDWLESSPNRR